MRPRRHAELLLEKALGIDRTTLYLNAKKELTPDILYTYEQLIQRRLSGEPVQYIVEWTPFYNLKLEVGPGVFIPRFDSEALVEAFLKQIDRKVRLEVLDVCCGCGALGLAGAYEADNLYVILSDISDIALSYAQRNIDKFNLSGRVCTYKWDALSEPPIKWYGKFDYILANPPYISITDLSKLHRDVREGEPREALTDGGDGLSFYRHWAKIFPAILKKDGKLFVEIGDDAQDDVKMILMTSFIDFKVHYDLSGRPRVLEGKIKN